MEREPAAPAERRETPRQALERHLVREELTPRELAGLVGLPYVAPYCATKFAVVGLSESLAAELATHNIQVTTICPGPVDTGVLENARLRLPGSWNDRIQQLVSRLAMDPDKVARQIVRAVQKDRNLATPSGLSMTPLWAIKRLSNRMYNRLTRLATRLVRKT